MLESTPSEPAIVETTDLRVSSFNTRKYLTGKKNSQIKSKEEQQGDKIQDIKNRKERKDTKTRK